MPYDDSNIKKMVKDQTEKRVAFSKSKQISEVCKGLVYRILEVNSKKRTTIPQMFEHPWLAVLKPQQEPEATKLEKMSAAPKIDLGGTQKSTAK